MPATRSRRRGSPSGPDADSARRAGDLRIHRAELPERWRSNPWVPSPGAGGTRGTSLGDRRTWAGRPGPRAIRAGRGSVRPGATAGKAAAGRTKGGAGAAGVVRWGRGRSLTEARRGFRAGRCMPVPVTRPRRSGSSSAVWRTRTVSGHPRAAATGRRAVRAGRAAPDTTEVSGGTGCPESPESGRNRGRATGDERAAARPSKVGARRVPGTGDGG